jgi:hypothetical protein
MNGSDEVRFWRLDRHNARRPKGPVREMLAGFLAAPSAQSKLTAIAAERGCGIDELVSLAVTKFLQG